MLKIAQKCSKMLKKKVKLLKNKQTAQKCSNLLKIAQNQEIRACNDKKMLKKKQDAENSCNMKASDRIHKK